MTEQKGDAKSGTVELDVKSVFLRELLDASLVMQRRNAARHGITMELRIENDTPVMIEADEKKLGQILSTLLDNAVKFTPANGSVKVAARRVGSRAFRVSSGSDGPEKERIHYDPVTQDSEADRDSIKVTIEDTGIGIRQEDLPKLFQEFPRVAPPCDKKNEAAGLGLAFTKKLVELHGGEIWAESEFGKGSLFAFVLPVKQRRGKDA